MMETQMIKESYERSELAITMFSEEDVIVTSDGTFTDDVNSLINGDNWHIQNSNPSSW